MEKPLKANIRNFLFLGQQLARDTRSSEVPDDESIRNVLDVLSTFSRCKLLIRTWIAEMQREDLILIAEDNPDEEALLRRAIEKAQLPGRIRFMADGEQVLLYLQRRDPYTSPVDNPLPAMIILDLKMPRKSGFEVLEWLQVNAKFAVVPINVMSASGLDSDVQKAYRLGANTYFVKPGTDSDLVETMKSLKDYWTKAKKARQLKDNQVAAESHSGAVL